MAPNLIASQHELIRDMIINRSLTTAKMTDITGCSTRSIKAIRSNLRYFGNTKAPSNGRGRRRSITPSILDALYEHLLEKPNQYLDEIAVFLWDEFEILTTTSSISRALTSTG
jgi:hypothetical protein